MAAAVSRDPGTALPVHTREELGVGPFGLPSAILASPRRWSRSPRSAGAAAAQPGRTAGAGRRAGYCASSARRRRDSRGPSRRPLVAFAGPAVLARGHYGTGVKLDAAGDVLGALWSAAGLAAVALPRPKPTPGP